MTIHERISTHNAIVTHEGDILPTDDASSEELPMSNEARISRMHPRRDFDAEIEASEAKFDGDIEPFPQSELETPQSSIAPEVEKVRADREARREDLRTRGYPEARIKKLLAQEFGASIAKLSMRFDTSILTSSEDASNEEAPRREADWFERQVGSDY